jgi:hypothetical protein
MVGRSVVAAVDIDIRVVSFVEESAHVFDVVVVPWDSHELTSAPHWLPCIGINYWLVLISGLGQRLCVMRS